MDGNSLVSYVVTITPDEHMIYGADAICKILKRGRKEIPGLVKDCGLNAWKDKGSGQWRALCTDLLEFNNQEKERYMKGCQ